MPSATGPSLAGILAVVAGLMTGSVVSAFCGTEESPALLAAHGELAAMDAAVFPRFASSVDSLTPVSIDVYVHVIASSADKVASREKIDEQMRVLNSNFQEARFSFITRNVSTLVDDIWAIGEDQKGMKTSLRQGDARSLNIFVIDRHGSKLGMAFGVHANATTTYPELLAREPSRYLLDGVMIDSGVLPGESWLGKVAVHEVGHWLGLRHPDESKDCVEDSDMIADTPVAKRTRGCPDKPVRTCGGPDNDPVHNHMSYTNDSCRKEFTQGQIRRMHQIWEKFRANGRALDDLTLQDIQPVMPDQGEDKLPFYPPPKVTTLKNLYCYADRNNVIREDREIKCGSCLFCEPDAWKRSVLDHYPVNGTQMKQSCLDARTKKPLGADETWDDVCSLHFF